MNPILSKKIKALKVFEGKLKELGLYSIMGEIADSKVPPECFNLTGIKFDYSDMPDGNDYDLFDFSPAIKKYVEHTREKKIVNAKNEIEDFLNFHELRDALVNKYGEVEFYPISVATL